MTELENDGWRTLSICHAEFVLIANGLLKLNLHLLSPRVDRHAGDILFTVSVFVRNIFVTVIFGVG